MHGEVSGLIDDQAPDPSRRALLQAAGLGMAFMSCPIELRAAHPRPMADGALDTVDFRYAPPWWQTAICLPDDPEKTLVGDQGQLLFDFGFLEGGPFGLLLQPQVAGGSEWIEQTMLSPRVPVVRTRRRTDGIDVCEETFVVTPEPGERVSPPLLSPVGFQSRRLGLARPPPGFAPAFAGGAVCQGRALNFKLAVARGATITVVYGLCESRFNKPGEYVLELSAEGCETRAVDPIKDFGTNQPGLYKLVARDANLDGFIDIQAGLPDGAAHVVPVLSALWAFSGAVPADDIILSGKADDLALASYPATLQPARRAVVLMKLTNTTVDTRTCRPELHIRSEYPVTMSQGDRSIRVGSSTCITGSAPLALASLYSRNEHVAQMPLMTLQPGVSREVVFTVDRHASATGGLDAQGAIAARAAAERWWSDFDLPYTTIEVPDRTVQDILESCVRNIWQARELKANGPAFQVGPTMYRGLWIVDGSFILESAAMLGRGEDARGGIEFLLSLQKADGSFEEIPRFWKENGIVLWAATRHSLLTQDKDWLRKCWPSLQRIMGVIGRMRAEASRDPLALNYRLFPGGFIDGGLGNRSDDRPSDPEYSTVYWILAGMNAYIGAARWLGDEPSANETQKEFDDLLAVLRRACNRDTLQDGHGNAYVPTLMGNQGNHSPQKGQWSFCHAVYPGQVFAQDDPIVAGQLAMLRASKVEGMVCDTGWKDQGIWGYFASFYAHAQLWLGEPGEAVESLYAFANHACPTRAWIEEQMPRGQGSTAVWGDMPHNWASAEFIRLTAHLLQLDRGNELHLLEGLPRQWVGPGMVTRLNGLMTPFGSLTMELKVAEDGRSARLRVDPLSDQSCSKIVVHLGGLSGDGETRVIELEPGKAHDRIIAVANSGSGRGNGRHG